MICRGSRLDGTDAAVRIPGTPLLDTSGNILGFRGVGSGITEAHLCQTRIRFLVNHDALTALPDRRVAHDGLTRVAARSSHFSWLAVDLDEFKNVNDSHSHDVADRVLVEVSRRLVHYVGDAASVADLGATSSACFSTNPTGRAHAKAREIIQALSS